MVIKFKLLKWQLTQLLVVFLILSSAQLTVASPIFSTTINLSTNGGTSQVPQIATSGSNVYVVWQDDTGFNNEILFKASTNNGTSFAGTTNLSNNSTNNSVTPRIAASASNVYVTWQDDNNISFSRSTDGGSSFDPVSTLSAAVFATEPKIAISGSNIYVIWQDSGDIFFNRSTDGGSSFDGAVNLSSNAGFSSVPQIAAAGSNVYVSWQDDTPDPVTFVPDILFMASTDNGTSFGGTINISNNAGFSSSPQIAAAGNNAYVIWQDTTPGNFDILFVASSNNGASFDPTINISSNSGFSSAYQITASGSNVYVGWQDDTVDPVFAQPDILFKASTDNGASFGGEINISGNSAISVAPGITSSGSNVYVIWKDFTNNLNGDIFERSSQDSGATFEGVKNISTNSGTSENPQATVTATNLFVTWQDNTPDQIGFLSDILFKSGTSSPVDITFDQTQYKQRSDAILSITDPNSNQNPAAIENIYFVKVSSTTDPNGISLTLTETGANTGIFTGSLTLTADASSGNRLKVMPGDTVTASFSGQTGTALIFTREINFDFALYDHGDTAHLTVSDQNANHDPLVNEQITLNIKSNANKAGVSLVLTETGPDTGIFGTALDNNLIFMGSNNLYQINSTITLSQNDAGANVDPTIFDTTTDIVFSTSDPFPPGGVFVTLNETGVNTGIFQGTLVLTTGPSVPGLALHAVGGDIVSIVHLTLDNMANGLVVPNPNPSTNALLVQTVTDDTVTALYNGVSQSVTVQDLYVPGGGGGGLVRPGLVLNVLAGISGLNGGSVDISPPLFANSKFNPGILPTIGSDGKLVSDSGIIKSSSGQLEDYPLSINNNRFGIYSLSNKIETQTVNQGDKVDLGLVFFDTSIVSHIALYFTTGETISENDPHIIFEKGTTTILDSSGLIGKNANFALQKTGTKSILTGTMSFNNPGQLNLIIRAWDENKNSGDTKIFDAFKVVAPPAQTIVTPPAVSAAPVVETKETKNTADNIIPIISMWAGFSSESISDSAMLKEIGIEARQIPLWVKTTAYWVVDGKTSTQEFLDAIEYMHEKGIVV